MGLAKTTSPNKKFSIAFFVTMTASACLLPLLMHLQFSLHLVKALQQLASERDSHSIYMQLGGLCEDTEDWDAAIACYRKALPTKWCTSDRDLVETLARVEHSASTIRARNENSAVGSLNVNERDLDYKQDLIRALKELAEKHTPGELYLQLGGLCEDTEDWDEAIACYQKALPDRRYGCDPILIQAWERVEKHKPFDPNLHLCFGEAFQQMGEPAQAELEYKQALLFSPGHRNDRAEKLLSRMPALLKSKSLERPSCTMTAWRDFKKFNARLAADWHPPRHDGLLVTRCTVFWVDDHANVEIIGPSSSPAFDQSALQMLMTARYKECMQFDGPLYCDFACASEGEKKFVDWTAFGQFNIVGPLEYLMESGWPFGDRLTKRINTQGIFHF